MLAIVSHTCCRFAAFVFSRAPRGFQQLQTGAFPFRWPGATQARAQELRRWILVLHFRDRHSQDGKLASRASTESRLHAQVSCWSMYLSAHPLDSLDVTGRGPKPSRFNTCMIF